MKKIALSIAAVLLAGVGCSNDQALADMELVVESGTVKIVRDGDTIGVEDRLGLEPGDTIVTEPGALARFALEGGARARQGQIQGNGSVLVRSTTSVEAQEGEVLMQVTEATVALVEGVTARSSHATFRIDRGFGSVRVGVYEGSLGLDAPGQVDLAVTTLYEATLVAGALPARTRPYRLDEEDPWDQVLLKEVVNLEQELAVLARGLANQLGRQRPNLAYFRALVDREVRFMSSYLGRKPSDLLIGFTIARNAEGSLERAFRAVFDLYDEGARWGVAAKILEVEPRLIVAQLERLILGTGVVAADGSGQRARFTVAAADASSRGGSADGSDRTAPPDDGGTSTTPPSDPPDRRESEEPDRPPQQPPPDPDECSDTAECAVQDVEDQLPGPGASPSPDQEQSDGLRVDILEGLMD